MVESSQSAELHKVKSVQHDYSVSADKDKGSSALAAVLQEENTEIDTEISETVENGGNEVTNDNKWHKVKKMQKNGKKKVTKVYNMRKDVRENFHAVNSRIKHKNIASDKLLNESLISNKIKNIGCSSSLEVNVEGLE